MPTSGSSRTTSSAASGSTRALTGGPTPARVCAKPPAAWLTSGGTSTSSRSRGVRFYFRSGRPTCRGRRPSLSPSCPRFLPPLASLLRSDRRALGGFVLVVAPHPQRSRGALVTTLRRPVQQAVVGHCGLESAGGRYVGPVDGPVR